MARLTDARLVAAVTAALSHSFGSRINPARHNPRIHQTVCLKRCIYRPAMGSYMRRPHKATEYLLSVASVPTVMMWKSAFICFRGTARRNRWYLYCRSLSIETDLIIARGKRWSSGDSMYLEYREIKIHFEVVYLNNKNFNNAFEFLGNDDFSSISNL